LGSVVIDLCSRRVSVDGVTLHVTPIEYRLLEHLVREAGRVVTRDELLSAARQREAPWHDRALDVHVSHLRTKLDARRDLIRTVRGEGYVFCG
jgi:DNA-binding response OmpR family regulator